MISLPQKPKILDKTENGAKFAIEGLYPGYGITLGNALRRVLLSSLEGAAPTEVRIKGVDHEFTTIKGVLEDVIIIGLNLKKLKFKLHGNEPQKATLKIKGEKVVTGKDFEYPSQVDLINKDVHIATLTDKNAELELELLIENGLGYEAIETRKKEKLEIGQIALDAIFSPILKVSLNVGNMRVGDRTDFDRLVIGIETDGSIDPESALSKATQIIIDHFGVILTKEEEPKKEVKKIEKKEKKEAKTDVKTFEEIGLSARTINALEAASIKSIAGLVRKTEDDIKALDGLGDKAVNEIKKALKKQKLELKS
jgi:DNA-directed RNA polymerase subunit alpha